jgi:Ca2+-binding RTX toxin-like protein
MAITFGTGTLEDDIVFGFPTADTIEGLGGSDMVFAGDGDDLIAGNERFLWFGAPSPGAPGNNLIFAGDGNDTVIAGYLADTVLGGDGDDSLYGAGVFTSPGAGGGVAASRDLGDLMFGGAGDDRMDGAGGNDTLHGGDGADTIIGNLGRDEMRGGDGADLFVFFFQSGPGLFTGDTGGDEATRDVISDFQPGEDRLDLSGYSGQAPRDLPPVFLGDEPFRPDEARLQVRLQEEEGGSVVQIYLPFAFGPPPQTFEIGLRGATPGAGDIIL